jgi:predicted esterase
VTDKPTAPSSSTGRRTSSSPNPHAHHLRVERTARYYTLGAPGGAPHAIWFAIHGYAQLANVFIRYFNDLADDETLVVAPEALNRFYLLNPDQAAAKDRPVGATWMTREDRESEINDYVEYLDALYDEIAAKPAQFGATVNVIGFSQGTATATRWLLNGKAKIDRLVLWGGLIPPEADLSRGPSLFRGARLTLVLGNGDQYVNETMFSAEQLRLEGAKIPFDAIKYEGGHSIKRSVFPRLLGSS